jgi:hypothetical protein
MDGLQLMHLLSMDAYTTKYFGGLAMRDSEDLPNPKLTPALYVFNTGLTSSKGEHWCAAFFDNEKAEFFDPFGMSPMKYGFENLISKRRPLPTLHEYNPVCVQDPLSILCGHHCLFYAFHKCRGLSLSDILALYTPDDLTKNDDIALKFVLQFGSVYKPRLPM